MFRQSAAVALTVAALAGGTASGAVAASPQDPGFGAHVAYVAGPNPLPTDLRRFCKAFPIVCQV